MTKPFSLPSGARYVPMPIGVGRRSLEQSRMVVVESINRAPVQQGTKKPQTPFENSPAANLTGPSGPTTS